MTRHPRRQHHTRPTIGLALGGGAARGLAHVPVIEALEELGVRPAIIAGTSMGSIIGAAYAAGMTPLEIRQYALGALRNRAELARRIAARWPGALTSLWNPLTPAIFNAETLLEILMPDRLPLDFAGLVTPFVVVATDFDRAEQVLFDSGPLIPAIAASSALPALLKPVRLGDRLLIDGGFVNPTPFDILKGKADIVIAVDVTGAPSRKRKRDIPSSIDTWIGAAQITLHSIVEEKLKREAPDILIRPDVRQFGALEFLKVREIMAAAEGAKEELKRKLDRVMA